MTDNEEKLNLVTKLNQKLSFISGLIPVVSAFFIVLTFSVCFTMIVQLIRIAETQKKAFDRGTQGAEDRKEMLKIERQNVYFQVSEITLLNQIVVSQAKLDAKLILMKVEIDSLKARKK